jgi:glycogen(starch) synthase
VRVLQWLPTYLPDVGGIELVVRDLMEALRPRGFEFYVVASHGSTLQPDETEVGGVPVYRFHYRRALKQGYVHQLIAVRKQIAALKRRLRPDLVHVHFSYPSVYFHLQTRSAHPVPTLVTLHNSLNYLGLGGSGSLVASMLAAADWVTGVSRHTLMDALAQAPDLEDRSSVVYNALPTPTIEPTPPDFGAPTLLCLGRLAVQKGFDVAIDAMTVLGSRFPTLTLTVAGDGLERDNLEAKVRELDLQERVTFAGPVPRDDVSQLLNQAAIVLMPSRYEGFPLVALEAGLMERPVIASRTDGLSEAVLHGETGLLVPPEDPGALAGAIAELLEEPDRARRLGQGARAHVLREFMVDRFADQYASLYRRLGSGLRGPVGPEQA